MPVSFRPRQLSWDEVRDQQELSRLVLAYCHGIDRQDLALVRSLYHDDAIDDHGPMFCGSPDEYVAWLPSMLKNWALTAHVIHSSLFVVEGDAADGESAMTAYHCTADGAREIVAHGRYLDRCLKRDGVWRFYRRALALDWVEERDVQASALTEGVAMGKPSVDDPSYRLLPLFAR
jgi:hypothetical protein